MILSAERFIPHTLQHLIDAHVFANALPEAFYTKITADYDALTDVTVQRIVYESDGLKVTGLMALPTNITPGKHPLLIYNRGGNREFGKLTVLSAMRSMVPFAQAGYIVFASNYRGNDGGEGREEFGGSDVNDVMNLIAIGHENPAWDGKNTHMIGHSRGGMMTALAMKRGVKLNSAILIAALTNAHVLLEDPLMVKYVLEPLVPDYAGNPAALTDRSAVDWPQALNAPILLLHGDKDERVNVENSQALQTALTAAKKTSELVIYPGGNHALIRHWNEVLAACLAWMKRFTR